MMVHTTFGSEEMDITWQLIELVSALLSQRDCLQFGVNCSQSHEAEKAKLRYVTASCLPEAPVLR